MIGVFASSSIRELRIEQTIQTVQTEALYNIYYISTDVRAIMLHFVNLLA